MFISYTTSYFVTWCLQLCFDHCICIHFCHGSKDILLLPTYSYFNNYYYVFIQNLLFEACPLYDKGISLLYSNTYIILLINSTILFNSILKV